MENANINLVKDLLQKFLNGDNDGYLNGCHDEFYGKIFSGLIPGGEEIIGKSDLKKMFDIMPKYMEIKKFEPVDWCATGDTVYFTVNWEFLWKPTNQIVRTSANVRKIIKDNKIKEKYHIVNFQDVTGCSINWSYHEKNRCK